MKIILDRVAKGPSGENLPETSLEFESGGVTIAAVETAQRPTVLALVASGRMMPDAGTVRIEWDDDDRPSATDLARLRGATAVVDAPDVSAPVDELRFSAVVQEELMFAGRPSNRRATAEALDELGAADFAAWEVQNVPTGTRLRVLAELASARLGVEALVLTAPDRRGSDPFEWWAVATSFALRGFAVLVIASAASADVLAEVSARFEAERLAGIERREAEARAEEAERLARLNQESSVTGVSPPTSAPAHSAPAHPSAPSLPDSVARADSLPKDLP